MFIWPVVIVILLVLLFKIGKDTNNDDETPLDILRRRYANGEITKEQYEEMKKELLK